MHQQKNPRLLLETGDFNVFAVSKKLLTQAKSLNDSTITIDIAILEVVQQSTTLTYQCCQCSFSAIIFSVELEVLSQVRNTV